MTADDNDIFYFKLNTGEDIIGEVIYTDDSIQKDNMKYIVHDPMKLEMKDVKGQLALSLNRMFAFAEHNMVEFSQKDIITMMRVSETFSSYYNNVVRFNYLYIDNSTKLCVVDMNNAIASVISTNNQEFIEAMKKYDIDPDAFISQVPN